MAKTKGKRRRKHRGTQAGTVQRPLETRGRGGSARAGTPRDKAAAREAARQRRNERMDRPPTWRSSAIRAGLAAVFVAVVLVVLGNPVQQALLLAVVALVVYVPLGYAFDNLIYRLRQRRKGVAGGGPLARSALTVDVRSFTVGPVQENCYLVRRDGADRAVIIDPGEEADRLLGVIERLGVTLDAILLTHTHFDHVGAVAPIARQTGAEVWVPEIERPVLADIMSFVPWPGFGPFESWEAEHTLVGGERLELAGLDIDVISTPGHSPGHVSFSIAEETSIFSGDVLFQGSVGRVDLPGGDWPTLRGSISTLVDSLPPETVVYPGHMGVTTLGDERATNPFLAELAS